MNKNLTDMSYCRLPPLTTSYTFVCWANLTSQIHHSVVYNLHLLFVNIPDTIGIQSKQLAGKLVSK